MHTELAQANLYRVRGEIDLAEKQCLSILKRFPNEPEAHSLLGELSADRGDIPRAIEWYELAIDLNPNSAGDRARLEELREKVRTSDTAHIEEQLSLNEGSNTGLWIGIGVFVVAVILMIIYSSLRSPTPKSLANMSQPTIVAPTETSPAVLIPNSVTDQSQKTDSGSTTGTSSSTVNDQSSQATLPMGDRALMQLLQQRSTEGANISTVEQDPRDKAITVTYQVANAEDARHTGATLAKDALTYSPDSLNVTVRGVSGDRLVFVADATRPKLTEIETQYPQNSQAGNDTWISAFLSREWTDSSSTGSTSPGSPAASTSGTSDNSSATSGR